MIKYFSRAFKISNDNIILTTPLLLFIIMVVFYLGVVRIIPENIFSFGLIAITTLFMLSAFFAGWLFMVKKAIELDKQKFETVEDKAKSSFGLIKEIPAGVGEYFFPILGGLLLYGSLTFVFMLLTYKLGAHFIGKVEFDPVDLKAALSSSAQMKAFVSTLSVEQLVKLNEWNLLIMASITTFSFITMFWAVEILNRTKNAFVAFFKSLGFLFKNLLTSIILFVYVSIINFLVSLLGTFASINPILHFFATLVYFYFVVYVVVLIFLYYDSECTKQITEKACEPEAQDNCDSGADSVGQEQPRDSDGENP